jgi:hypothetical protein
MGTGKIFIAKSNFAIHKIEYTLSENSNFQTNRSKGDIFHNLSRKSGDILFEIAIEYKEFGDKMFLNYMTFNNRFIIKDPNPFKVKDFSFNPKDQSFYITFNRPVLESSIERKSNFKLRYQNKKLIIKNTRLVKEKMVKVSVVDWSAGLSNDLSKVTSDDFSYKLKKIKDDFGSAINKEIKLIGYQFRELYTQEVFENKTPTSDLIFVDKVLSLSKSIINTSRVDLKKYWINTPLKQTKGNSRY